MASEYGGYLIYHPSRKVTSIEGVRVYHDSIKGNQDPYLWNTRFLYTYCHITQMRSTPGHVNIWVSGDTFPDFTELLCDLVFVVEKKLYWENANSIHPDDPIVDSLEAFNDHYQWHHQHYFNRLRRYTLKAHPSRSFQPQDVEGHLFDILPLLTYTYTINELRKGLRAGIGSKPMPLDTQTVTTIHQWLIDNAVVKHRGEFLEDIRKRNDLLASPPPSTKEGC